MQMAGNLASENLTQSYTNNQQSNETPITGEQLLEWFESGYKIRRFEEEAARAYTERKIGGFLHLYIGQEAVALGVMSAIEERDYVVTAYRDHGHFLARGGSAREAMAELYGKETGCAGGRGGSMHFFDASRNFLGGYGIVGAHVPLAAGVAFASKYRNDDSVAVCFLGDGAVSIGPFHEGLCLAALWKLPVVFIVENNRYSMGTPLHRTMTTEDTSIRALAYPMARDSVDGCDVVECYRAAERAVNYARSQSQPVLLEYRTYRYRGHSMADPAKYRTKEEVNTWRERDPLVLIKQHLEQDHSQLVPQLEEIKQRVEDEVQDCVQFADSSPDPDPSTVEDFTYVD